MQLIFKINDILLVENKTSQSIFCRKRKTHSESSLYIISLAFNVSLLIITICRQCAVCCHSEHYNSTFKVCSRENGIAHSTSKLDTKTLKGRWARERRTIIRVSYVFTKFYLN